MKFRNRPKTHLTPLFSSGNRNAQIYIETHEIENQKWAKPKQQFHHNHASIGFDTSVMSCFMPIKPYLPVLGSHSNVLINE